MFTDTLAHPPGLYTLEVRGSNVSGTASITHDFTFTLLNPCPSITLAHSVPLFTVASETYTLGQPTKFVTWSKTIVSQSPSAPKCGDFAVEIYYNDPNDTQGVILAAATSPFSVDLA